MPKPLPRALQQVNLRSADHLRYLYYTDTPYSVDASGALVEIKDEAKSAFVKGVAEDSRGVLDRQADLICACTMRLDAQAEALRQQGMEARTQEVATASRLLTGLGYKNSIEVGLTLHALYGLPYLPGSAVKGLVRAWAASQTQDDADRGVTLTRFFGSATKEDGSEDDHQLGALTFFDALPARPFGLEADVMTPHFAPYYQDPERVAPAVWHDPNPVAFLAVPAGVPFRFLIAARPGPYGAQPGDLDTAFEWLASALAWLGAGGKTAAGYGRFETDAFSALFSY